MNWVLVLEGEITVTETWKSGAVGPEGAGRGSDSLDLRRPGMGPGVRGKVAEPRGGRRPQGRERESSRGGATRAGGGQFSTA